MDPNTTPPAGALEPGARLSAAIERPAALGRGVAHAGGLTLLVRRGIPGEHVQAEVERVYAKYALARVRKVEQTAPERVEPPCSHFAICGGCDWQHVEYTAQLAFKREVLADQLRRIGRMELPADFLLEPAPSPLEYRERLEFVPVPTGAGYLPGFHGLEGKEPFPVMRCHLAPPVYTRLAAALLEGLVEAGVLPPAGASGGNRKRKPPLRRIAVQGVEGEGGGAGLAVFLHLKAGAGDKLRLLRRQYEDACRALLPGLEDVFPELTALALRVQAPAERSGGRGRSRGQGRSIPLVERVSGPEWLSKRIGERSYLLPHTGFFQVHPAMTERLIGHVVQALRSEIASRENRADPALPVGDLYGGAGLFSLPLAAQGFPVVCVDHDRALLRAGTETARRGAVENIEFHRLDLEKPGALQRIRSRWGPLSALICDPPRRGLSASLGGEIRESGPPLLAYVSCDGGTFARDAARLAPAYELVSLRGFDLFPQTHHLEMAGIFRRKGEGNGDGEGTPDPDISKAVE